MTRRADTASPGVFVSYAPADERWAAWIAWQLELAGFRTMLRAWDCPVGIGHGFWHVVNLSRFEVGELDGLLPEIRRMPPAAPF